jgi:HlyD family secretion protein
MPRRGRTVLGAIALGFVALALRGLTRVTVCLPTVDSTTVSADVVKPGLLPHDLFGAAIHSEIQNGRYVRRAFRSEAYSAKRVFKISSDGQELEYVRVKFGRVSSDKIEVLSGLMEGDRIVVSDMSAWEQYDRVRLK